MVFWVLKARFIAASRLAMIAASANASVSLFCMGSSIVKRRSTLIDGNRSGDILKDLNKEQLAGIGMVALAYNEAESYIHFLVGAGFELRHMVGEVTQRVNGITGLCELAKLIVKNLKADETVVMALSDTLGAKGFQELKTYRDAVIHCRIFNSDNSIAVSPGKRGTYNEILLTEQALDGLYQRLIIIREELICFCNITLNLLKIKVILDISNYSDHLIPVIIKEDHLVAHFLQFALNARDKQKSNIESEIQEQMAQALRYQRLRLTLPPLPEFPSAP